MSSKNPMIAAVNNLNQAWVYARQVRRRALLAAKKLNNPKARRQARYRAGLAYRTIMNWAEYNYRQAWHQARRPARSYQAWARDVLASFEQAGSTNKLGRGLFTEPI